MASKIKKGLSPERTSRVRKEARGRRQTPLNLLAFDFLVHVKGWKPHQAAAIVGRLQQESGLNPDAVGDNGTAFGLAQWRGERNVRRLRFHRERGNDPKDVFAELDFVDWEMRNYEKEAFQTISAARTVQEAAKGMMAYERPKGFTAGNPAAGHGWDNTLEFSTAVMVDSGLDPELFSTIEGQEPFDPELPSGDLAPPEKTTLGDVMSFGSSAPAEEDPAAMDSLQQSLDAQMKSIYDMISQGAASQLPRT